MDYYYQDLNYNDYFQTNFQPIEGVVYQLKISLASGWDGTYYRILHPNGLDEMVYDQFGDADSKSLVNEFNFTITLTGSSISAVADPTNPVDEEGIFTIGRDEVAGYTDDNIVLPITIPGLHMIGYLNSNLNFVFTSVSGMLNISAGTIHTIDHEYGNDMYVSYDAPPNANGDYASLYTQGDGFTMVMEIFISGDEPTPEPTIRDNIAKIQYYRFITNA